MSESFEDVIDVALRVAEALESIGAGYFIGGSLASSLLDQSYLLGWAARLDLSSLFDRAVAEAGT